MKHTAWKRSLPLWALLTAFGEPGQPALAAGTPPAAAPAVRSEPPPPPPRPAAAPARGGEGAAKLQARLDSIVLDEVTYDSLPLTEVVRLLIKEAAARDPEKAGVNFLLGQPAEPIVPAPSIDPATGLPISGGAVEWPDLASIPIRIVPPLRKVRLSDALDAIQRVADRPITYTVESYAVVFSLDAARINSNSALGQPAGRNRDVPDVPAPRGAQVQTRSFKLNTNTLFLSLKQMPGRKIDPSSSDAVSARLRDVFTIYGARLAGKENRIFYNPVNGMLLVRGSQDDLNTIQAAIETLGGDAADSAVRGAGPNLFRKPDDSPATPPGP